MANETNSLAVSKLACPKCGNEDLRSMQLFAETIETDRYSFDRMVAGDRCSHSARA
jgi:hypothetical protein